MTVDQKNAEAEEPIAIVGMGCRWPGGIRDGPGLWEFLKEGRSAYEEFAAPRFSAKGFYHPNRDRPGSMTTKGGFLLREDPRLFDPSFFGVTSLEAETMDASQRKLLEVVYEAFENAGETWESVSGSSTGVFIGNFSLDHWITQARDWDFPRPYATTGASTSILANRINYIFNLKGPSLALDTACSSSMYALHLAVNAIRRGDCDSAIVAAANWIMDPSLQIAWDKLGALSPTSACHTFDASADGYARGEGFAAIYLKRLSTAVADSSPIRAVIRGTAMNSNGRTGGITRPSAAGQEAVIRKAYENAGHLSPEDTTYFEMHGTGTPIGDPIEVSALGNIFAASTGLGSPQTLLLGSVKTNLGHAEGASALAGIMKVVLALEAGMIPPSIGVETLNPAIDFGKARAEVVTSLVPWPEGRLRRASVNSFGFGGANGHCIIDHVNNVLPGYEGPGVPRQAHGANNRIYDGASHIYLNGNDGSNIGIHLNYNESRPTDYKNGIVTHAGRLNGDGQSHDSSSRPQHHPVYLGSINKKMTSNANCRRFVLLPLSSHSDASLECNIASLSEGIKGSSLADVAYTLGATRSQYTRRSFRIVEKNATVASLGEIQKIFQAPTTIQKIAFVFTGQGAQWFSMGSELLEYWAFRNTIEYLSYVVANLPNSPSWNLADIVSGHCDEDMVHSPDVSQTLCTAVQIGLVDLLASWSIYPSAVLGHSSGEMAAAYAGGYMTAAESITAAWCRGATVLRNCQEGAMLAVGLGPEEASDYIAGMESQVKIAAINSPNSVTLSGEAAAIRSLGERLTTEGAFSRLLKTGGNAYHSHHMASIGQEYEDFLSASFAHLQNMGLGDKRQWYPRVPWISSVTPCMPMVDVVPHTSYWRANLENPVRFSDAVSQLIKLNLVSMIIEVGSHSALKSAIDQTVRSLQSALTYSSTLKRNGDARRTMLLLAGTVYAIGGGVDLAAVNAVDEWLGSHWVMTHGCLATNLPPYQYAYGPISYNEGRLSKEYRLRKHLRHDLLGSRVPGTAKLRPQWRNIIRLKDLPWLGDHRLLPHVVFPAAGFISMAMVAASQVHEESKERVAVRGYSLRNVHIKTAMIVPEEDHGMEVVFCMELPVTSSGRSPDWASFSISSVKQSLEDWTEHCTGLIRVEVTEGSNKNHKINKSVCCRPINSRAWYRKFASLGLGYGPTFQGLSQIHANAQESEASAQIALRATTEVMVGPESEYPLHPTALDATLQLGIIACHGGQPDKTRTAFVPTHIPHLFLRKGGFDGDIEESHGTATARGELRGLRGAYVNIELVNQIGDVVLQIDNLRYIRYQDSRTPVSMDQGAFTSPFTRLVWRPDARLLDNTDTELLFPVPSENVRHVNLFPLMDKFACLFMADVYERLLSKTDSPKPSGQVAHFVAWIKRRVEHGAGGEMTDARALPSNVRLQELEAAYKEIGSVTEAQAAKRLHENMEDILHERRTAVDLLIQDNLLTALYGTGLFMTSAYPQLFSFFDLLGHADPNLSILELGAGTGGASRIVMKALTGSNGMKRYNRYTFTDISAGFLSSAREVWKEILDVDYAVLDIEQDPLAQGFESSYAVLIASQTLHATASISNTLRNCRSLLKPGGKLVLVENTRNMDFVGIILGTLTGYWHGIPDGRTDSPFLSRERWDMELRKAGFSGIDLALSDYPEPHNIMTVLVSSALTEPLRTEGPEDKLTGMKPPEIQILYSGERLPPLLHVVSQELEKKGIPLAVAPTTETAMSCAPLESRTMIFLDVNSLLLNATEDELLRFQYLVRTSRSIVVITSGSIARGIHPDVAFIPGLMRTLATENPGCRFLSIDIDANNFEIESCRLAESIINMEADLQQHDSMADSQDGEFIWQDGCMWVSRFVPDVSLEAYAELPQARTRHAELLPLDSQALDWITVKVEAVGLNWKDLGLSSGRFDANNLSSEYAGTITEIGSSVANLHVGDRVYGTGRGHFGNYTRVPAVFAQTLQSGDDVAQMVTMPLVYMTAVYAFEHLVNLKKTDKVLIQSATGGLGLAAICLAQAKGAEVYATAGTAEKARFLIESLHISPCHVFSSRSTSELAEAVVATGTGGFDVILSTSQGDMLYASIQALAPLGHLIDVGRTEVIDSKAISLELFQKSASFSSFDLSLVLDRNPTLGSELMKAVDDHYRAGRIGYIRPFTASCISQLDQTLLNFSNGTHIGKNVVTFSPEALVKIVPSPPLVAFDGDSRYIVSGGMGGLGRAILQWMCSRGARDIVVLTRSRSHDSESRTLCEKLSAHGATIRLVTCDVSDLASLKQTVQGLSDRPIRGVIHAAVVYQDISFDKISIQKWRTSLAAKVHGTKNLHEVTIDLPLDFFVMTTSMESVFALATQSAYTAANVFQEAFARYRRQKGLVASTISFGFVNDVGALAAEATTVDTFDRNRTQTISENQFLRLLESAFAKPVESPSWMGRQQDPLSASNIFTGLDPAALAKMELQDQADRGGESVGPSPRWYTDARVSHIMRACKDAQRHGQAVNGPKSVDREGNNPKAAVARLRHHFESAVEVGAAGHADAVRLAIDALVATISQMLFIDISAVNVIKTIAEHGIDSLIAAELRSWLLAAFGCSISTLELLDSHTTIQELAVSIADGATARSKSC